jgi:hypothetical protein
MSVKSFSRLVEIGDPVHIAGNPDLRGFIDAILMTEGSIEYRFVHWDEEQCRCSYWVRGFELVKIDKR